MNSNTYKEIQESHQRCRELKIREEQIFSREIHDDEALQQKFSKNRNLILTASPYMEQLLNFVKGTNFFILLTDGQGCILNAIGDERILSEAFELKMIPGANMSEESIGTNAMAMVIKTQKPIQLSGEDHFIKVYHKWTCSASPIKDASKNLIGVLNLTGYTESVHPHTLGMVIAASNAIEEMLKLKAYNTRENIENTHIKKVFNTIPVPVLTSDMEGKIKTYNLKAIDILGNDEKTLKTRDMSNIIENWDNVYEKICMSKQASMEISIRSLRNSYPCYLKANTFVNLKEDTTEIVYVFDEVKKRKNKNEHKVYYTFDKIIGKAENFEKIIKYAKKIADSKSTILLLGESGTGKEMFAQSIHNYSSRADKAFIALNCGAIPNQLIESELFGYEDGAYTGAKKGGNVGKFELSNGGTIMLDEIGEMPLDMQIKLLRVLQEGVITRIGSQKTIYVDVRVIAATNKDLKKEVALGRFRKDLYYRLNVLPLYLPPLRQRKEDIPLLTKYFMKNIAKNLDKQEVEISKDNLDRLMNYNWPGNIRELENVVELIINTESVPEDYFKQEAYDSVIDTNNEKLDIDSMALDMDSVEKKHVIKVLEKYQGNISHSAKALGIRRNTLYNKIKKYNIKI